MLNIKHFYIEITLDLYAGYGAEAKWEEMKKKKKTMMMMMIVIKIITIPIKDAVLDFISAAYILPR